MAGRQLAKPRLTSAEKQRLYRARRDADPERRVQYLQKERQKWRRDIETGRKKLVIDLSERGQHLQRKKWKEAHERNKAKKTALANWTTPPESPESNPEQCPVQLPAYKNMSQHALLSVGAKSWRSLACSRTELRLDLTLGCGQTFRWRETGEGHWTGVMGGRVWTLTQTDDMLWYYTYGTPGSEGEVNGRKRRVGARPHGPVKRAKGMIMVKEEEPTEDQETKVMTPERDIKEEEALKDYFQLNVRLADLYREWGTADNHFKCIAKTFTGVRMLRQDPTECLFSFICTSNNHISRIQGMVERLCHTLGPPLCQLDGTSYHDFPTLQALADSSVEACLRNLGFGYRARFLQQSARQIVDTHGSGWLDNLRSVPYFQARDALRTLPGVGLKVADCVCLMSLDKACAVPVDTHVWQIAQRDYRCGVGKGQKSLTDKVHRDIGDFFRQLWGPYAGWAHSVLFCSDLKKFQKLKEIAVKKEEVVEVKITSEKTAKRNGRAASARRVKREAAAE